MLTCRRLITCIKLLNFCFITSVLAVTIYSASASVTIGFLFYKLIFYLKYFLVVGPQVLDIFLIVFSFYLMLDGVCRWGANKDGAFSRTLIGLFILHASSVELPYVPYLALWLEFALCIRTAAKNREKQSQQEEPGLGYSLQ